MIFKGCGVNLVTPFTETNEIDFDVLGNLIEKHLESDINAIILGRETGEFQTMNDDEIISIVEFTVKKVNSKVPVIVQTGLNDMSRSVLLSIRAKMAGADALILSAPYFNLTNAHGLLNHFKAIALSAGLPCFVENNPERCGYDIPLETVISLSEINGIKGIIESSTDANRLSELKSYLPSDFQIICGSDKMTIPAYSLGIESNISVFANIWNDEASSLSRLLLQDDFKSARELYFSLYKIIEIMDLEPSPIPVKTTMNMLGYNVGEFRLPLAPMDPDKAAKIVTLLMDMNIITIK